MNMELIGQLVGAIGVLVLIGTLVRINTLGWK